MPIPLAGAAVLGGASLLSSIFGGAAERAKEKKQALQQIADTGLKLGMEREEQALQARQGSLQDIINSYKLQMRK
jgi:hypothetical protein